MKSQLLATAALGALALGATLIAPAAQAAAPAHFGGFVVGVDLGYVDVIGQIDDVGPNYANDAGFQDVDGASGVLLGGRLGYDAMVGGGEWLIGGELNVAIVSAETAGCDAPGCFDYHYGNPALTYDLDALSSIRARGGYVVDPSALLYVFAGFAYAQATFHHYDSYEYDGSIRNFTGYTLGGGAQYAVNNTTDVRFEVAYYDFGSKRWNDNTDEDFGLEPEAVTLSLGAVFHINRPAVVSRKSREGARCAPSSFSVQLSRNASRLDMMWYELRIGVGVRP